MSVTSCTLMREGWTGSGTLTDGNSFTTQHIVESNDKNDGPLRIVNGAEVSSPDPLPKALAKYNIRNDSSWSAVVTSRSSSLVSFTDSGAVWSVQTTYSTPKGDDSTDSGNPLRMPVRYSLEWAHFTIAVTQDKDGWPIINNAGRSFPDPIEIDDPRPVLVAKRNIRTFGEVIALSQRYQGAINSRPFFGAPKWNARVESITAGDMQMSEGVAFYEVSIRVLFSNQGFLIPKLEEGFEVVDRIVNGIKVVVQVKDDEEMGIAEPVPLDRRGFKLAENNTPSTTYIHVYEELDFSGLGI